jgi:imidazolonepropionase-like amidohydrolase
LRGATIYVDPLSAPIRNGVVIIRDGRISAVGPRSGIAIPEGMPIIDVQDKPLLAGFWNSHVHFDAWSGVDTTSATRLTMAFREMLTRWGFTTVFETDGDPSITAELRRRIATGEVAGPRIFTTGPGLPARLAARQLTPAQATAWTDSVIRLGVDAVKVYAQHYANHERIVSPEVLAAVVREAHRRGLQVLAHPSNTVGLTNSVNAGVDVLAHTTPQIGPWRDLVATMMARNIALIPTLKLWPYELTKELRPPDITPHQRDSVAAAFTNRGVMQLREYHSAGGTILFGTDVGYMLDYSTLEEFELMARAGMGYRDILASLTTAPAARRQLSASSGRIAVGFDADLVVLRTDPAQDVRAFAEVLYTIRGGRIIFGPTLF